MMKLAVRIYVFCLEEDRGVMFYDQSPDGAVAMFSGSLPKGVFLSSGEQVVEWNPETNGVKPKDIGDGVVFGSVKVKCIDGEYVAKT